MHTAGAQRMYSHTHTRARLDACVHQPVKQVGMRRQEQAPRAHLWGHFRAPERWDSDHTQADQSDHLSACKAAWFGQDMGMELGSKAQLADQKWANFS
jgi:hypothetical protein